MTEAKPEILRFVPFQSCVTPDFWHKLAEVKIDVDRLAETPKPIFGYYTNRDARRCLLEVDYSAFNSKAEQRKFSCAAVGTICNKNTLESFKGCDKLDLLKSEGQKLLDDFKTGRVLENPRCLARFFVLSFADLKTHNFYYWFAFPCPLKPTLGLVAPLKQLIELPDYDKYVAALQQTAEEEQRNFFVLKVGGSSVEVLTLKQAVSAGKPCQGEYVFCFADASSTENPSWFLRVFAAFIFQECASLLEEQVKFLGLRLDRKQSIGSSLIWQVKQIEPLTAHEGDVTQFVGWEANASNKLGPRLASMKDSMDRSLLAEKSVHLNLKLMKWRNVPDLNLDVLAETKCLLFGAGTLGCAVARNLLSWGFKHITFVDSGTVSFSNPVRQSLYRHADAVAGNKKKALTAPERLKEINPNITTVGYDLQIPMPGHTVGPSMYDETVRNITQIEELVQAHDVLYLLTDSRESRWLPTLLGAVHQKIVITTALGFGNYLVMRHGSTKANNETPQQHKGLTCVKSDELGCYFCHIVSAPGNTSKDLTLDQQCTVTRPGVSNIASAYAVELLVTLLQNPLRELTPAYYAPNAANMQDVPQGILGACYQMLRGSLDDSNNIQCAIHRYRNCMACSEIMQNEYRTHGIEFLMKAFESSKYLEDLTGLTQFNDIEDNIDFDDDELEILSSEEEPETKAETNGK